ncbi:MAG: patatin-like phospholipase family protein, partial [Candidatus Omnitrophica bacterium]|nr:patatin-like phospholipase family protein [Candidatus Omnitrophota bacterium]
QIIDSKVILPDSSQVLGAGFNNLILEDFKEDDLSGYITEDEIDRISLVAASGDNFLAFLNFLSESYHFILYEIPFGFSDADLNFFIEPAQSLHFLIFPEKGALKKASNLIQELTRKNPLNKEKVKVILAEFSEADHLSFAKKRGLLEHPIHAALSSRDSADYIPTLRRLARQIGEVTVGVALGSGAAYGYAHIGVLKVLTEAKIPIDIICGTSMGAVIAALWAAGFSIPEIVDYSRQIGKRIGSFSLLGLSIPFRGIMRAKRLESILKRIFGELTFYDLKHTLKVVTFDFPSRQAVILEEGLIYKAVAASCAFPGIFEPVSLRKDILLDGGILNPLPTKILLQYGAHRIIASNITLSEDQARSEYAKKSRFHIFDFIFGSIETMQQQFIQQAIKLADLTIHSNLQGLGWTEFDKIEEFIQRGEAAAREKLPEIKKLTFS